MNRLVIGSLLALSVLGSAAKAADLALSVPETPSPSGLTAASEAPFNLKVKPINPAEVPMLAAIQKQGAKLFFIGERSGLQGFFALTASGLQILYVTPDKKSVLVGALFTSDARLVTVEQIRRVVESNPELAPLMKKTAEQNHDAAGAGATREGVASLPFSGKAAEMTVPGGAGALPAAPLATGDRLWQDLTAAAGVTLGANEQAPLLYMVVSPTCEACSKTWDELRDMVKQDKVRVKVILIGEKNPAKVKMAARFLEVPAPFEAFDKFIGGDSKVLAGDPSLLHLKAAASNETLMDRWDIRVTPYLVYQSKDAKVKIVQGRPDRIAALLTDMGALMANWLDRFFPVATNQKKEGRVARGSTS